MAKHGEVVLWGVQEHLTATLIDMINLARWEAGGGKGARPKPLQRPGKTEGETQHYGEGESWTVESFNEWLAIMEAS